MRSIEMAEDVRPPSAPDTKDILHSEKTDSACLEKAEDFHATDAEIAAASLSVSHKEYLIERHGTLDLDPIPSPSNADPYNWPLWKKVLNLVLVAFHACMATLTAASITPAYEDIAIEFGKSVQSASYLTSLQIAILGGAPLFWKPLSNRFGRRPIFLIWIHGCVPSLGSLLHITRCSDWKCCCDGNLLQERESQVHGRVDTDGHIGRSSRCVIILEIVWASLMCGQDRLSLGSSPIV